MNEPYMGCDVEVLRKEKMQSISLKMVFTSLTQMKYAFQQTLISSPGVLSNCCCVTITAAGFKYESHGGKIFLRDIRARSAGLIAPKTLLPLWEMETNEFFISQPFPSISCHDLFFFSASVLWFMSLFLSWRIKAKGLGNSDNLQRISSNYDGDVPLMDSVARLWQWDGRCAQMKI